MFQAGFVDACFPWRLRRHWICPASIPARVSPIEIGVLTERETREDYDVGGASTPETDVAHIHVAQETLCWPFAGGSPAQIKSNLRLLRAELKPDSQAQPVSVRRIVAR